MSSKSEKPIKSEGEERAELIRKLQQLGEVASTETALFHQAAADKYGLGITDMKALSSLIQEGPKTAGELGARLSLTSGSVTTLVDRLERRGLVGRKPHATDRRKVVVVVIPQSLAQEGNVYQSMGEAFARLLESYSLEQLEFLAQFYEATIDLTRREIARLASNDN